MMNVSDKPIELFSENLFPRIGKKTLKGSTYPYMTFHGDTWRKKSFFEEAVKYVKEDDEEQLWQVIKKVWIDFNLSTDPERTRMKKQGRLTTDYLLSLAQDNCPCCGSAMWYGRVYNMVEGYRKPSLDRMDPDGGYVNENVWIICNVCNTRKNNSKAPLDLVKIAVAWREQEIKALEKYKKYAKDLPSLEKFFGE
jgi:hypothetical protein